MRKTLVIALREYKAAVKTKSFIIVLFLMPVMMGGGIGASYIFRNEVDISDKKIVVIDHSGLFSEPLQQSAKQHNETEIFNPETNEKIRPAYIIEFVKPDLTDLINQKLELSKRVKSKDIGGFVEIGPSILHPDNNPDSAFVRFYSESSIMDDTRNWFTNPINNHLRKLRMAELNLTADSTRDLFYWTNIEGLGLVKRNENTGDIKDAERSNMVQSLLIPYILVMLMFMIVMMGTSPLLNAVMEEKMEKIAEVLLATVTPFQFMAGKILGSTCVSLTTATIYVIGGIVTAQQLGAGDMIPYHLIPWFYTYLIFFLIMAGSIYAALGSACNDNKDAQNVAFPANLPMIFPLFLMMPVLQNPTGAMATWLSLFPPFTPMLMIVRQATPITIPAWQPYVGLVGMVIFTVFTVWVGSKIFRTGILMQGQKPTLANLFKNAFKG